MEKLKTGAGHPAWKMLAACCFIQFGGLGVLANSIGVFFPSVCGELGFTLSEISVHIMIRGIATTLTLPLAGRLIEKYPAKRVLTPAALALALSIGSMAFFNELWQWYAVSVVYGAAGAFLFLNMSPIILTNWFKSRRGLAVGAAMASAGLGGMIMNPLGTWLIETYGWRAAYLIFAAVGAAAMLPFTLFVLKRAPEDMGAEPYEEPGDEKLEAVASSRLPQKQTGSAGVFGSPSFWLFIAVVVITSYETVYIYHFPQYAISVGLTAMAGSAMSSASMAGNLTAKLCLGWLNDRLSAKKTFFVGMGATAAGLVMITVFRASEGLMTAGAFLYGACMALTAVTVPLIILELFGSAGYARLVSAATMAASAMGGIGTTLVGALYDGFGGYGPGLYIAVALCAAAVVFLACAFHLQNKSNMGADVR